MRPLSPPHIVAIAVLFISVGCAEQSIEGPSSVYVYAVPRDRSVVPVSGRVLDFATNAGIAGASVAFGNFESGSGRLVAAAATITDAAGSYTLSTPAPGSYLVQVDGVFAGTARIAGIGYRGDLLAHPGACVSRYGTIMDGLTQRPIAGATISLSGKSVVTGADGWYRIDLGCTGPIGFNTTFMYVSAAGYLDQPQVVGRGVAGVDRRDVWLYRRKKSS
jgi:hypothetical protein